LYSLYIIKIYKTKRLYKGNGVHECAVVSQTGAGSKDGGSLRGDF